MMRLAWHRASAAALGLVIGVSAPALNARPASQENPAIADLRKAAQLGDLEAEYNLAVMYDTGRGVPQNYAQAAIWYRRAAERGMVRAQYNLALLYEGGLGVRQDDTQAVTWYRRAADRGDAPAQYNLAIMYENGRGVPHDYGQALSWYGKAAEQGHAGAMYNLGAMYYRGQGVEQDYVEAHKWRHLAAVYAPPDARKRYSDSLDAVAKFLTPPQVAEAEQRARDWTTAFQARATAGSQAPPAPRADAPIPSIAAQQIFKSAIDVVEVEMTVVDAHGRQVRNLSSGDFELKVDGSLRPVASFTYISHPMGAATAHAADVKSPRDARRIVIAVDEGNISGGAGRGAIQAAQRLLGSLNPSDRVALFAFPSGSALDFTVDHARVQHALDRVAGRAPRVHGDFGIGLSELFAFAPGASQFDRQTQQRVTVRECPEGRPSCEEELRAEAELHLQELTARSSAAIASLSALFTALEPIPGWKTVILISEGLSLRPDAGNSSALAAIATKAAAARVRLDSILLGGDLVDASDSRPSPSPVQDRAIQEAGLRDLTDRSGGLLLRVVGKADEAFDRLAEELSGYYLVAFSVKASDRDGRAHAIHMATSRGDVTIRTRSQFIVPPS